MQFRPGLTILFLLILGGAWLPPATTSAQATSPATMTPETTETGTVVGADGLNIRSCPGLACAVVASVKLGDSLTVTGRATDGYYPVRVGDTTGYAYALFIATPSGGTPELRQGLSGCKRVALIFNIGVGYEPDVSVLDWLKANDIPATLFPMGWWAEENPELLKKMANDGFLIGSHGDERVALIDRPDSEVVADIQHANDTIKQIIGEDPAPYFTPYAAATDERVRAIVAQSGRIPVAWDVPAADWDFDVTPDDVFMSVVPNVVDGSIVEFHLDAPSSAQSTAVAVPWIVERLENKGFTFVSIADMALPCPAPAPPATPTP